MTISRLILWDVLKCSGAGECLSENMDDTIADRATAR